MEVVVKIKSDQLNQLSNVMRNLLTRPIYKEDISLWPTIQSFNKRNTYYEIGFYLRDSESLEV